MFRDDKVRVDFSSRRKAPSRSALLREAKEQRLAREVAKKSKQAAKVIQRFWHHRRAVQRFCRDERKSWDTDLCKDALIPCARRLSLFYNPAHDESRLRKLVLLVLANHKSFFAGLVTMPGYLLALFKRLCIIICDKIADLPTSPKEKASPFVLLLWLCTDASQWSKNIDDCTRAAIDPPHIQHKLTVCLQEQAGALVKLQTAILRVLPLPGAATVMPKAESTHLRLLMLVAMTFSVSTPFAFLENILSIPLLHNRLAVFKLDGLLAKGAWVDAMGTVTAAQLQTLAYPSFLTAKEQQQWEEEQRDKANLSLPSVSWTWDVDFSSSEDEDDDEDEEEEDKGMEKEEDNVEEKKQVESHEGESNFFPVASKQQQQQCRRKRKKTARVAVGPCSKDAWLLGNVLGAIAPSRILASSSLVSVLSCVLSSVAAQPLPKKLYPAFEQQLACFQGARLSPLPTEDTVHLQSLCSFVAELLRTFPGHLFQKLQLQVAAPSFLETLRLLVDNACTVNLTGSTAPILALYCSGVSTLLFTMDDDEFLAYKEQFASLLPVLNRVLAALYWSGEASRATATSSAWRLRGLRERVVQTFTQLRDRQSRSPWCDPALWIVVRDSVAQLSRRPDDLKRLLRDIPFAIPFAQRAEMFSNMVTADKAHTGANDYYSNRVASARVRRGHVLEDGFRQLAQLGWRLKHRIQVEFVSELGLAERGIDGGGLFKEFLLGLLKEAFDPKVRLFAETPTHLVYPSPHYAASPLPGLNRLETYSFIGQMVGKALYDGITIEPQLANFFLRRMLGEFNYVNDLSSLDPELHRHLLFLKRYDGDVRDLALTFVADGVPLVPGGESLEVTADNRINFMYQMAHLKLNKQIKKQTNAFLVGLSQLIPLEHLKLFTADELSRLLSGQGTVDLDDLRRNTQYNMYSARSEVIVWFWEVFASFSHEERGQLLRFATSCSRSPLMGFRTLTPNFCIQRTDDVQALPTASTCINLLRLPDYPSKDMLEQKLRYAMSSGTGFQLS